MGHTQNISFPGGGSNSGIGTSTEGPSVMGDVAIFRPQRMMARSEYAAGDFG
jgi:hypothetical protein